MNVGGANAFSEVSNDLIVEWGANASTVAVKARNSRRYVAIIAIQTKFENQRK